MPFFKLGMECVTCPNVKPLLVGNPVTRAYAHDAACGTHRRYQWLVDFALCRRLWDAPAIPRARHLTLLPSHGFVSGAAMATSAGLGRVSFSFNSATRSRLELRARTGSRSTTRAAIAHRWRQIHSGLSWDQSQIRRRSIAFACPL